MRLFRRLQVRRGVGDLLAVRGFGDFVTGHGCLGEEGPRGRGRQATWRTELCPGIIFPTPYPQGYGATPPLPRARRTTRAFQGACPRDARIAMAAGLYSRFAASVHPAVGGVTGGPCRVVGQGSRAVPGRARWRRTAAPAPAPRASAYPGRRIRDRSRTPSRVGTPVSHAPRRAPPCPRRPRSRPGSAPGQPPPATRPATTRRATWSAGRPSAASWSPWSSSSTAPPSAGPPAPPSVWPP